MSTTIVWNGAAALRDLLVPIDELEPWPGNPRRGDVTVVRESLERFGQVRPIVVFGRRIVAGHHVVEAATELGWTHIAVGEGEFASEDEAQRFGLMDNRSHDLGDYDTHLLQQQLSALAAGADGLAGTGYDGAYLNDLLGRLAEPEPPAFFPTIDPAALDIGYCCPRCHYEWAGSPRPNAE